MSSDLLFFTILLMEFFLPKKEVASCNRRMTTTLPMRKMKETRLLGRKSEETSKYNAL
jgi:hypothetical protein